MAPTPIREPSERLIEQLAAGLTPVRRTGALPIQAAIWLGIVALSAAALWLVYGNGTIASRITTPDLWLAVVGSSLTAVLAVVAALMLSRPDRPASWALLPVPALLLWIGASGAGCLRSAIAPDVTPATFAETRECLTFILGFSLPLSCVLVLMLRQGYPLRPGLTFGIAGLAAAAAAATLLNFCHPFDATLLDLGVHAVAAGIVIVANQLFGRMSQHRNYLAGTA